MICIECGKVEKKFIADTKKKGSILDRAEYEKFLKRCVATKRYDQIMKNLSIKPLSWTVLKKALEIDLNELVYDKNFSRLLETLKKSCFIKVRTAIFYQRSSFKIFIWESIVFNHKGYNLLDMWFEDTWSKQSYQENIAKIIA